MKLETVKDVLIANIMNMELFLFSDGNRFTRSELEMMPPKKVKEHYNYLMGELESIQEFS